MGGHGRALRKYLEKIRGPRKNTGAPPYFPMRSDGTEDIVGERERRVCGQPDHGGRFEGGKSGRNTVQGVIPRRRGPVQGRCVGAI